MLVKRVSIVLSTIRSTVPRLPAISIVYVYAVTMFTTHAVLAYTLQRELALHHLMTQIGKHSNHCTTNTACIQTRWHGPNCKRGAEDILPYECVCKDSHSLGSLDCLLVEQLAHCPCACGFPCANARLRPMLESKRPFSTSAAFKFSYYDTVAACSLHSAADTLTCSLGLTGGFMSWNPVANLSAIQFFFTVPCRSCACVTGWSLH